MRKILKIGVPWCNQMCWRVHDQTWIQKKLWIKRYEVWMKTALAYLINLQIVLRIGVQNFSFKWNRTKLTHRGKTKLQRGNITLLGQQQPIPHIGSSTLERGALELLWSSGPKNFSESSEPSDLKVESKNFSESSQPSYLKVESNSELMEHDLSNQTA